MNKFHDYEVDLKISSASARRTSSPKKATHTSMEADVVVVKEQRGGGRRGRSSILGEDQIRG
jgi:hypothetical protein